MRKTKENGITLIALIITIIVMLILVGVTVAVALNGGLFTVASKAKYQTEVRQIEEVAMAEYASMLDENLNTDILEISDLNISDELKGKYSDKLIINEGKLYYNIDVVTDEQEQNWLKEIGIYEYIGSYVYYSTLQLAISDANNLTTENADIEKENRKNAFAAVEIDENTQTANILLLQDTTETENIEFTQNVIFNLNRKNITMDNSTITYSKDFSIKNGKIIASSTLSAQQTIKTSNTSAMQEGTLKIENLQFEKLKPVYTSGASIYNINTTSQYVFIKNSKIILEANGDSYSTHMNVGARYAEKVLIENCEFSSVSSSAPENLRVYDSSDVEINNCYFYVRSNSHGGIQPYITNIYGNATINEGTFKAETNGSACNNIVCEQVIVNGATFESEYLNIKGNATINDGTFDSKYCNIEGSATISNGNFNIISDGGRSYNIYANNQGIVTIENGEFNSYSKSDNSYCVYASNSATVKGGTFISKSDNGTSYGVYVGNSYGKNVSEGVNITADIP